MGIILNFYNRLFVIVLFILNKNSNFREIYIKLLKDKYSKMSMVELRKSLRMVRSIEELVCIDIKCDGLIISNESCLIKKRIVELYRNRYGKTKEKEIERIKREYKWVR